MLDFSNTPVSVLHNSILYTSDRSLIVGILPRFLNEDIGSLSWFAQNFREDLSDVYGSDVLPGIRAHTTYLSLLLEVMAGPAAHRVLDTIDGYVTQAQTSLRHYSTKKLKCIFEPTNHSYTIELMDNAPYLDNPYCATADYASSLVIYAIIQLLVDSEFRIYFVTNLLRCRRGVRQEGR